VIYVYDGKIVARTKSTVVYPADTKVKIKTDTYYVDKYEVELEFDAVACYLRTWRE